MFCSKCGRHIPDDEGNIFCDNCGAYLGSQDKPFSSHNVSANSIKTKGFIETVVANYKKSSAFLILIGYLSIFLPWIFFNTTIYNSGGFNYRRMDYAINFSDILFDIDITIPYSSYICIALLLVGPFLLLLSYVKKEVELGKRAILITGVCGVLTFIFIYSTRGTYTSSSKLDISVGYGAIIWLIASILQIVLYVLLNKEKA